MRAGRRRMASWFQYPTFDSAPNGRMCQQVARTRSSGFNPLNEVTTHPLCPPNRDCGLACAAMALSALLQKPVSVQDIVGEAPQQAAWSIDLAHLLAGRGLKVVLCTRMPGVDTSHARLSFYAAQMEEDAPRVDRLFQAGSQVQSVCGCNGALFGDHPVSGCSGESRVLCLVSAVVPKLGSVQVDRPRLACFPVPTSMQEAAAVGIRVLCASLTDQELLERLSGSLAILLVDKTCSMLGVPGGEYHGHFILVCGFDPRTERFAVMDPSEEGAAPLWLPAARLNAARLVPGTDEDILFLSK